jgi:CPA2 family monovalent cation:H+ antiporter-2
LQSSRDDFSPPLRDLFAASFFFFFGLQIAPSSLLPALRIAAGLAAVTGAAKVLAGYLAGRSVGIESSAALRAGIVLVPRGEFSIVIAGLGVAIEPALGPLSASYVLLLAILGPLLVRIVK